MTSTEQNRFVVAAAVLRGLMVDMSAMVAEPVHLHGTRDRVRGWHGALDGVTEELESAPAPDPDGEVSLVLTAGEREALRELVQCRMRDERRRTHESRGLPLDVLDLDSLVRKLTR